MRPVVKALLFDVQGTATDFHSTVCDQLQRISAGRHPSADWPDVVRRWRAAYFTALKSAQSRNGEWVSVHSVYRDSLDDVLGEFGWEFTAAERDELTLAWRRLRPWPDVVAGLTRM
ncbi:MAG: haloacid dehalogenase type II, partial [Mycobacterium sp.]|nr:haloacid dehalogenase type II [Mycobacterium sp.]